MSMVPVPLLGSGSVFGGGAWGEARGEEAGKVK